MSDDRFFLDTAYALARVDRRDQHHRSAIAFQARARDAAEVWITEAVLVEIGNALAATNRQDAIQFIELCYRTSNIQVVPISTTLLLRAVVLYRERPDKGWGLTDCISFVVMSDNGLDAALTADKHFIQAGYRALLLEEA